MKVFVVPNAAPLTPFGKSASQIRFGKDTIASRLRGALAREGHEVAPYEGMDPLRAPPDSLVVADDVVASPGFFRRFVASLPNRRRSYRCHVDTRRYPLFSSRSEAPSFRALPITYVGDDRSEALEHRMSPEPVHEVPEGMPPRMHSLTDLSATFLDYYALDVAHWFDLQTATSLLCRELVADVMRPFAPILPAWLRQRVGGWHWLTERINKIGKGCRIHPTAVLEGAIVGDGVEVGPFSYVRASVIGDGAVLTERSSVKGSYLGDKSFVMGGQVVNCYVGAETSILTPMLFNAVFGERGFLSGGSGFADFNVGGGPIVVTIDGREVPTNLRFLGSAVGDDCFVGANLVFAPGRAIPDGTRILDHGLIKAVPSTGGAYVVSGAKLLQIPESFLGRG